jgi:DNA-binding CsgD family transcriptional regulator
MPSASGTGFTRTEQRILHQHVEGRSQREIALALGIGLRTVQWHFGNLHAKTATRSPVELALYGAGHEYCCGDNAGVVTP